jgi:hypothetical protein
MRKLVPHIGGMPRRTPKQKPGQVPDGRIPIYDSKKRLRGHCGPNLLASGVTRFGVHNPKLKKVGGKPAWVGSKTLAETSAASTASSASAAGTNPAIPPPTIGGSK